MAGRGSSLAALDACAGAVAEKVSPLDTGQGTVFLPSPSQLPFFTSVVGGFGIAGQEPLTPSRRSLAG